MASGAVATFGTAWTREQCRRLASGRWRHVYILFDPEAGAQRRARQLAGAVAESSGVNVKVLEMDAGDGGDPADADADVLQTVTNLMTK